MTRVEGLRRFLREKGLAAFIFPSTDPHCGEYIPAHWQARQWISGFDGSAGTAVVTADDAALWTDSRYFIAAEQQLQGTAFRLMKDGMQGTPTIAQWLCSTLPKGSRVGIDGWVNTIDSVRSLERELDASGIGIDLSLDPCSQLWTERPTVPDNPVVLHPIEFSGEESSHKLQRLRHVLSALGADGTVVSQLDEVAWLMNLRGSDVHCNPVFVSYLLVTMQRAILFVNPAKLGDDVREYLAGQGVETMPYADLPHALQEYREGSVLLDTSSTNCNILSYLPKTCRIVEHPSVVSPMKAVKNETEIRGFRQAMLRDGVAMVKFLRWLVPAVQAGGETEMSIDRKLYSLRASQPLFRDISFDTIAGYAAHGAIVHYEATPSTDASLMPRGFLLLDSGAQYQDGTTDITRTIALGPLTDRERTDYTLVLRGHIRLAMARFPEGACGTQLDVLARYAMWQHGINYLHGTGHGVGSYLNVHEGPHQIRMNYKPAPLRAGMTVTDEPGIYRAGEHGVRIENTLLIEEHATTEFGNFLRFDSLTLCPIDTTPIIVEMMQRDEIEYLNDYHQRVLTELSPLLDKEERLWLEEACKPI